jgi:hypothetical protein
MAEKVECSWEREMPTKCRECPEIRFISGILLEVVRLRQENYRLQKTLDDAQSIGKNLSHNIRLQFEEDMRKIGKTGRRTA